VLFKSRKRALQLEPDAWLSSIKPGITTRRVRRNIRLLEHYASWPLTQVPTLLGNFKDGDIDDTYNDHLKHFENNVRKFLLIIFIDFSTKRTFPF